MNLQVMISETKAANVFIAFQRFFSLCFPIPSALASVIPAFPRRAVCAIESANPIIRITNGRTKASLVSPFLRGRNQKSFFAGEALNFYFRICKTRIKISGESGFLPFVFTLPIAKMIARLQKAFFGAFEQGAAKTAIYEKILCCILICRHYTNKQLIPAKFQF